MRTFIRDDHTIRLGLLGVILTLIYVTILTPLDFLEGLSPAVAIRQASPARVLHPFRCESGRERFPIVLPATLLQI